MYWLRRCTYGLLLVVAVVLVATFVPSVLDPTTRGPIERARDRLWVSSSPYFLDRQVCRWMSLCGLHHLRRDPAALAGPFEEDPAEGELRKELRKRVRPTWEAEEGDDHDFGSRGKSSSSINNKKKKRSEKKRNPQERRKILKDVPDYVIKHAPLVHLYSGEQFWPSDIREHIEHMTVTMDREPMNLTEKVTLRNMQKLNEYDDDHWVVLHSVEDVESRPNWLHSHDNIPSPFPDDGTTPPRTPGQGHYEHDSEPNTWYDVDKKHPLNRISDPRLRNSPPPPRLGPHPGKHRRVARGHKPDADGYSQAPAVLVLVDKGSGVLDAFWFFFYSYNLGQTVLGMRFGNHVGDWEHCMVRFENGVPRGIFFSEHEGGQAYAWEAVEKRGDRPVIYSAVGSHAMYALPGNHPYVLPFKLLKDVTDKGPIWDPALNNYAYHYDYTREDPKDTVEMEGLTRHTHSLVPAASNPDAPVSWFHFHGRWGDEVYTLADPRQWRIFGQYHYVTGPSGPKFKQLDRSTMCQSKKCRILYEIDPKGTWY